nr:neutral/alkaline non-lysosomal ceramidase N-terminal domain-containing protein [Pleionea sp. CnH1-48]
MLIAFVFSSWVSAGDWLVGSGIYDVTGPAAEAGMVGYGEIGQKTKGIHTRLWSRAYVIEHPSSGKRVAFVSADLMSIPQSVKLAVVKKLKNRYGSRYDASNVMLTATHTHVGPGGYDHFLMLNMTALGYDKDNFNAITEGIFQSIVRATSTLASGNIFVNRGELLNTSINRSPLPYSKNPEHQQFSHNTDKTMTLLKFVRDDGTEIGMLNWFPVHTTSNSNQQRFISSDNKGVASMLFEKDKQTRYDQALTFVAAFANSNQGDVSPHVCGPENGCGSNGLENTMISATKQLNKAMSLYNNASQKLSGHLDYRHQHVFMPGYSVSNEFTQRGTQSVCEGALGWSMAAGAGWDGPSNIPGVVEGMTVDNEGVVWNKSSNLFEAIIDGYPLFALLDAVSASGLFGETDNDPCQYPKPTLVNRKALGTELYAGIAPFQLFVVDSLAIVAVNGEMTTMAGRRLKRLVLDRLTAVGVTEVVIAGLANSYQGYITTPEEFSMQHYEGGHTLFGPNTLPAYLQVYAGLANAIVANANVAAGPTPQDRESLQIIPTIGVVYDDKRLWESFGQVMSNASSSYQQGDSIKVSFRSGHPKNNFRIQDSFLEVQRWVGGQWQTFLTDKDFSTRYEWRRDTAFDCLACSFADIHWDTDENTPTGTYRIVHKGNWKNGWTGKVKAYSGTSRSFSLNTRSQRVALKSAHNTFLVAESNGGNTVNANRNKVGAWEQFELRKLNQDSCARHGDSVTLKTSAGYYFSAQPSGALDADRTQVGSWEMFRLVNHSDEQGCLARGDRISLKSAHNRYVVAESNGRANANRTAIGSWERFLVQ